ncbi:MAG: sugar ABC transporter ATP-binding protein [Actinobacteria bacterium]|nr:sugar ABC transporter ATP-binding protein [Actinomycetota bacterium]
MNLFEANNISKRFGGVVALIDAEFGFSGCKICGLVGANGSGKTTFARICAGLINKDSGNFYIDGETKDINSPFDAEKLGIALAHQNLSLIPDLTVWENICLGHELRKGKIFPGNKNSMDLSIEILNDLVPGEISINSKISTLNPAQKQIVEIAKALYRKPKLLILDESTAALEYFHVEKLFEKIKQLKEDGMSIIFISHRLWEIIKICDLLYVFRNGKTVGKIDFEKEPRDENLIVPLITGGDFCGINYIKKEKKNLIEKNVIIRFDEVSYRNKLNKVSFEIKKGEIVGIGGLHGQGQEELIMALSGAVPVESGKYYFEGKEFRSRHTLNAIRKGIYLVPGDRQKDGLFNNHSILRNIIYPRFTLKKERLFLKLKNLYKITGDIIKKISINPPESEMTVKNLSGGNQQKVVFGRWLQFQPKVILLNDPTKGVDIETKDSLYRIVNELSLKGTTVILYSSSNEEIICNCDRVFIMFEGKIVEEIEHEDICEDKLIKSSLRVGEKG